MKNLTLSDKERAELNKLWHVYGNNGPKSNHAQHRFIQEILEKECYDPTAWSKPRAKAAGKIISPRNNFNGYALSGECYAEARRILNFCQEKPGEFEGSYLLYPNGMTVTKYVRDEYTLYQLLDVRGRIMEQTTTDIAGHRGRWRMLYGKPKRIKNE